jgi:chromate transporter
MSVDEETPLKKAIIAATEDDDELSYDHAPLYERIKDIIKMYWHLGFVSFGGTAANIAFMQDHLVKRNNWIPEDQFLELFALCQGLPGPTSSQLLISTASTHGGMLGGSVAFGMWSFPGCAVLTFAGLFLYNFIDPSHPPK